jgi:hypothetical protein
MDYPVKLPTMKISKKDKNSIKKELTKPNRRVKPSPSSDKMNAPKKISKSEMMLKRKVQGGKVKDLNSTRKKISKKTGSWPNGMTN